MIQVHQISRLWEECQKHNKQYIKHRQKRQWHSKKNHRLWTYNDTTNITLRGTKKQQQQNTAKITGYYCLIKDENTENILFF